jgi:carbon-monoxide dehydrogenase small subunit
MELLTIRVNGKEHQLLVGATTSLLEVLREHLHITSPKVGCETGECGACSVEVDGTLRHACLTNALSVNGAEVTTLEGLGRRGSLHPLQRHFYENYASQCGYCTPGMIMASKAILEQNPNPTEEEIKEGLSGNLCRCTGYINIIKAVKAAAQEMSGRRGAR